MQNDTPDQLPSTEPIVSSPAPAPIEPVKKSRKGLIVGIIVASIVVVLVVLGIVAAIIVNTISKNAEKQSAETVLSENLNPLPEGRYFDNLAAFNGWHVGYDDAVKAQAQSKDVEQDVKGLISQGRDICTQIKTDSFATKLNVPKPGVATLAAFATAPGSLCEDQSETLASLVKSVNNTDFTKNYEYGMKVVLDGTASIQKILETYETCRLMGAQYYGSSKTVTQKEADDTLTLACTIGRNKFDTDLEYVNYVVDNRDEMRAYLKDVAEQEGILPSTVR